MVSFSEDFEAPKELNEIDKAFFHVSHLDPLNRLKTSDSSTYKE